MNLTMRNLSLVFAAGCWGALWNGLAVWLFGILGIAPALGVHIAPPLTPAFLYAKLVWGGLWGLLFLLPLSRWSFPVRGLLFSLRPHPGATLPGFSPDGPQRGYGLAAGRSHSPPGGVLQCHLGVCRGLVVKLDGDE